MARMVLICTRQRKTAAPAARKGMRHDEAALQQHDDDHDAHVRHVHALLWKKWSFSFITCLNEAFAAAEGQ